jgi:DNA-binding response OmpR family regulator
MPMASRTRHVLAVEDNPTDAFLVGEALNEHGVVHDMTVLPDGAVALEYLDSIDTRARPDLIILDLNIPKYDGLHVLTQFRMSPALVGVPIIVLTSSDSLLDERRAKTIGVTAFLRKPMDLHAFLALGKEFRTILGIE